MRILFVSTSFPPAVDMHTNRNVYLVRSLLEHGHSVDIMTCGEYKKGSSSFDSVLDKTISYRTKYPFVLRYHQFINKRCNFRFLKKIHNVLVNYYAVPDLYVGWEALALKMIKKNCLTNYDAIITSSGSYTAHSIGKQWKLLTGRKWIAEYGDPWGLDSYGNIRKLYYKLEYPIISSCDGLVFTTQATINAYRANYPSSVPYMLVPNGYDKVLEDSFRQKTDSIKFIYTGIAYKKDRDLTSFIKAIGENKKSTADLVGTLGQDFIDISKNYSNVKYWGRVNYNESLSMISMSDVVVLIGNYGTLQIPGKTYAYLSCRKPLLYIQQQSESDPTYQLLMKFEGVVFCRNTENDLSAAIEEIVNNYPQLKVKAEQRCESDLLKQFTWNAIGDTFTSFVENV